MMGRSKPKPQEMAVPDKQKIKQTKKGEKNTFIQNQSNRNTQIKMARERPVHKQSDDRLGAWQ